MIAFICHITNNFIKIKSLLNLLLILLDPNTQLAFIDVLVGGQGVMTVGGGVVLLFLKDEPTNLYV